MSSNQHWVDFEDGFWGNRGIVFQVERFFARLLNGYHKSDIWSLNRRLREVVPDMVVTYTTWQCEHGKHLPKEFETDPAAWAEILRKIERAWMLLRGWHPERDENLRKEIEEGMALFGKYFNELHG